MKSTKTLHKDINNVRDGHHLNSPYWKQYKLGLPDLPKHLVEVAVGMVISDATMYRVSTHALIKFEQGYQQEFFVMHLFDLFKAYCFMLMPGKRMDTSSGVRKGLVKSYWFKTFSHYSFSAIWDMFYVDGKKVITEGLVMNHVTDVSLAYWVMGDGALDGQVMTLHTQGYSGDENRIISNELNAKFGFNTEVIKHKGKYFVVRFASSDGPKLHKLIAPHMLPGFLYKLPKT